MITMFTFGFVVKSVTFALFCGFVGGFFFGRRVYKPKKMLTPLKVSDIVVVDEMSTTTFLLGDEI